MCRTGCSAATGWVVAQSWPAGNGWELVALLVCTDCCYVHGTAYVVSDEHGASGRREGGEEDGDGEDEVSASVSRTRGEASSACQHCERRRTPAWNISGLFKCDGRDLAIVRASGIAGPRLLVHNQPTAAFSEAADCGSKPARRGEKWVYCSTAKLQVG